MHSGWKALIQAAAQADHESIETEYQNLFIGIGRGEVMPFGSWHQSGSLMDKPLVELRQDLRHLGYEREEKVKEPEDHIAALCEVMALLISDNSPQQGNFFSRHIATWYDDLVKQIERAESAHFYLHVANLLKSFFELEQVALSEQKIAVHLS
jgi:TorA maturation chaperone TorD